MSKAFFVHTHAINESRCVGQGTHIWAFAHVLAGAKIGRNCNICDHVFIENDVVVGHNVTIKSGVQLWNGIRVGDEVFIGPNAAFTNDPFPRSKRYLAEHPQIVLESGCSIGANATILPGLTIGRQSMIGAGAVVTQSVPPFAIAVGNPARITGYVGASNKARSHRASIPVHSPVGVTSTGVRGVTLRRLPQHADMRGELCVAEHGRDVPFVVNRHFYVFNVPSPEVRGQHAHRRCHQFLICLNGSCTVMADDGHLREEFVLSERCVALHLPPLTWAVQYRYSADAVLLVLASRLYEATDYIRDYDEFLRLLSSRRK